jgi:hypothetical protein
LFSKAASALKKYPLSSAEQQVAAEMETELSKVRDSYNSSETEIHDLHRLFSEKREKYFAEGAAKKLVRERIEAQFKKHLEKMKEIGALQAHLNQLGKSETSEAIAKMSSLKKIPDSIAGFSSLHEAGIALDKASEDADAVIRDLKLIVPEYEKRQKPTQP